MAHTHQHASNTDPEITHNPIAQVEGPSGRKSPDLCCSPPGVPPPITTPWCPEPFRRARRTGSSQASAPFRAPSSLRLTEDAQLWPGPFRGRGSPLRGRWVAVRSTLASARRLRRASHRDDRDAFGVECTGQGLRALRGTQRIHSQCVRQPEAGNAVDTFLWKPHTSRAPGPHPSRILDVCEARATSCRLPGRRPLRTANHDASRAASA